MVRESSSIRMNPSQSRVSGKGWTPRSLKLTHSRLAFTVVWLCFALLPWLVSTLWSYWYLRLPVLYWLILPYLMAPVVIGLAMCGVVIHLVGGSRQVRDVVGQAFIRYITLPYVRVMHGYDVVGIENIPPEGHGGFFVGYHSLLPIDILAFGCWYFCKTRRVVGGAIDRVFQDIPLFGTFLKTIECVPCGRDELINDLRNGHLRFVMPGGAYEAMFSENYRLEWRNRVGFAQVAKEAGVPVIPMFTINTREHITMHFFGFRERLRAWYLKNRIPVIIAAGGWPVKLRTYLGKPLTCGENETLEQFAKRIHGAVEELRDKYQRKSPSIALALADRFTLE